jgi:hypothetical protein
MLISAVSVLCKELCGVDGPAAACRVAFRLDVPQIGKLQTRERLGNKLTSSFAIVVKSQISGRPCWGYPPSVS